tara:strand:- start:155 stop:442 length:288 start_codon:yes stop_codon:yes gene_type:complete
MDSIKENLISEIIRVSQTNLLGRCKGETGSDEHERDCVHWIQKNAAKYRKHFHDRLDEFSSQDLGGILKKLQTSQKDLNDILDDCLSFPLAKPPA